jgi:hypothetical protein
VVILIVHWPRRRSAAGHTEPLSTNVTDVDTR